MASASESIFKTTSMCTAACIAQAFLGLSWALLEQTDTRMDLH